jgi:hypothetical protein
MFKTRPALMALIILSFSSSAHAASKYNFGAWDSPYHIEKTRDGGHIIAGVASAGVSPTFFQPPTLIKIDSSNQLVWKKTYTNTPNGWPFDGTVKNGVFLTVKQTRDGGYIAIGSSNVPTEEPLFGPSSPNYLNRSATYPDRILILKTKSNGDLLWHKTYEFPKDAQPVGQQGLTSNGADIVEVEDGFIAVGSLVRLNSLGASNQPLYESNALVLKVDGHGKLLWNKALRTDGLTWDPNYPFQMQDIGKNIVRASDGNFFVGVASLSYLPVLSAAGSYETAVTFLKIDGQGTVLSKKSLYKVTDQNTQARYFLKAMKELPDGGYIAAGHVEFSNSSTHFTTSDVSWVARYKKDGNLIWYKELDNNSTTKHFNQIRDIIVNSEGDFIAVGYIGTGLTWNLSSDSFDNDGWIMSLNGHGAIKWQKQIETVPGYTAFRSLEELPNGGYRVVGTERVALSSSPYSEAFVLDVDKVGNPLNSCGSAVNANIFVSSQHYSESNLPMWEYSYNDVPTKLVIGDHNLAPSPHGLCPAP